MGATLTVFLLLLLLLLMVFALPALPLMVCALMVLEGPACACAGTWAAFRGKKKTMISFHNRCS